MKPRRGWVQRRMREVAIERAIERKRVRAAVPFLFAGLGPPRRALNLKGMRPMIRERKLMVVLESHSVGQESTFATKTAAFIADCERAGLDVEVRLAEAKEEPAPEDYAKLPKPPEGAQEGAGGAPGGQETPDR